MTDVIPTKRFAVSTRLTDEELFEYSQNEQAIMERIHNGLLKSAQTILPQYPGYTINDPHFEVDRDLMHQWTVVTLTFRLTPGA